VTVLGCRCLSGGAEHAPQGGSATWDHDLLGHGEPEPFVVADRVGVSVLIGGCGACPTGWVRHLGPRFAGSR